MRETVVGHIIARLEREPDSITSDFRSEEGIQPNFTAIDELLPLELAEDIYNSFPDVGRMRLLDSFRERKYTSKSLDEFEPLITDATIAFQDERVIKLVSEITGIKDAIGDPHFYAGGISVMEVGNILNPHIDNSHDHEQKNYRVLNLLYYVTPGWKPEYGGNLELWDEKVAKPTKYQAY